ncbi:MAG: hypothetical protein COB41_00395 [Proteobacteria bacterium]|nr:MAG: hypothetical protein COB41_00395 [Pseudomonadota bacterium]
MSKRYVIEIDNKLTVISATGYNPSDCLGELPSDISRQDEPYIKKIPVYEEGSSEIIIRHDFEVDQTLIDADPNYGQLVGV